MQIVTALGQARQKLTASSSARLDTEILLCSVLKCERTQLYTYPEQILSATEIASFNKLIALRAAGHPVAYLCGQKEFWSLALQVNPDTFIPRPETELLVAVALAQIPEDATTRILELGTGTGAIAIAIASERPHVIITATDANTGTLKIAKSNAAKHNIKHIDFKLANWFKIPDINTYDLIISNPPYICIDDPHLNQGDVRFEPISALVSGADGLHDIRTIIQQAQTYLNTPGWLLLEHGYNQAEQVRQLLRDNGYIATTIKDYSGIERVSMGYKTT